MYILTDNSAIKFVIDKIKKGNLGVFCGEGNFALML